MGVLDDGGYQLAIELEACCAWRPWLGDQLYSELRLHLVSASAWNAFMKSSDPGSVNPSHLRLQLKVRALLFDKALEFPEASIPSPQLNRSYLQLQPDNVYFSLEQDACDWTRLQNEGSSSMLALQAKYGLDTRDPISKQKLLQRKISISTTKQGRNSPGFQTKTFGRSDSDMKGLESDSWYDQWFDKNLTERMHRLARRLSQHKLPFGEQEALKRTPEGMAAFASLCSRARRRHQLLAGEQALPKLERDHDVSETEFSVLPEHNSGCSVPENPCPSAAAPASGFFLAVDKADGRDVSLLSGVSSQLLSRGASSMKSRLTPEEAELLSRKTVAKILESHGFEGVRQIPMDILCEVMTGHVQKLGSWLRIILDSYQRHLSPDEFLRMFLHKLASSPTRVDHPESAASIRDLVDYVKNEKMRYSQVLPMETAMMQQYQQMPMYTQAQNHSRQFAALQQSMYIENVLKKKQLPALRAAKMREELVGAAAAAAMDMKPYVSAMGTQPWMSQQMPSNHSQVLQHLKQQLQLPSIPQISTKPGSRMEGLHELLGSDVTKQEITDDHLEGTLGSPNKRKRKDY